MFGVVKPLLWPTKLPEPVVEVVEEPSQPEIVIEEPIVLEEIHFE